MITDMFALGMGIDVQLVALSQSLCTRLGCTSLPRVSSVRQVDLLRRIESVPSLVYRWDFGRIAYTCVWQPNRQRDLIFQSCPTPGTQVTTWEKGEWLRRLNNYHPDAAEVYVDGDDLWNSLKFLQTMR